MDADSVNLYLVGFMGTGKTTVGRAVAQRLGFQVLDSDQEIERLQERTIPQIFADEGEAAFRVMEREFIEHGHPASGTLVACGGGLIIPPGMLAKVQQRGIVMCLHASVDTILRRTQGNRNRPLLEVEDPAERIRTLYAAREPIYRQAGTTILTDGRPLNEVVQHILRIYRREALEWLRRAGAVVPGVVTLTPGVAGAAGAVAGVLGAGIASAISPVGSGTTRDPFIADVG